MQLFDKSAHVFDFYSLLLKILSKLSNTDIIINFGPAFSFLSNMSVLQFSLLGHACHLAAVPSSHFALGCEVCLL